MLKPRLIGVIIVHNGIAVQSKGFSIYLPIGTPEIAAEFLTKWGIDEIILLDIDASINNRQPDLEMIKRVSKKCFVPLTYGGGISSVETMKAIVKSGADKIALNHGALVDPELIQNGAKILGNQCIVVAIDVQYNDNNYKVYAHTKKKVIDMDPVSWAIACEKNGAGEILLNSVNNDGLKNGYDLALIKQISDAVSIPIIALGGVGHPQHLAEGLSSGSVTAVAAANFFQFSEHSPIIAKSFLQRHHGLLMRNDTYATYNQSEFLNGRIQKKSEADLAGIKFKYFPSEVI